MASVSASSASAPNPKRKHSTVIIRNIETKELLIIHETKFALLGKYSSRNVGTYLKDEDTGEYSILKTITDIKTGIYNKWKFIIDIPDTLDPSDRFNEKKHAQLIKEAIKNKVDSHINVVYSDTKFGIRQIAETCGFIKGGETSEDHSDPFLTAQRELEEEMFSKFTRERFTFIGTTRKSNIFLLELSPHEILVLLNNHNSNARFSEVMNPKFISDTPIKSCCASCKLNVVSSNAWKLYSKWKDTAEAGAGAGAGAAFFQTTTTFPGCSSTA